MRRFWQWIHALLRPLVNEMGVIPSSLTDEFGALLTTTLRAMQPRIRDNITKSNKVLAYLQEFGRFRFQDGGERVQVPLMHALNSTADIYQGYGTLSTTPQDGITSAFYDWAQIAVSISISRKEERQNSGRAKALNLLEAKTEQSMASAKSLLNDCIVSGRITASADLGQFLALRGKLDTSATGPLPLAALIDSNASRSVAVGNINGSTHSFWRNTATDSAATTFAGYKQDLNNIYNDCGKGVGGFPDLMIGDQFAWETYFNGLQSQERYFVTSQRVIDVLGGMNGDNSNLLKHRGATFVWDEVVPDTKTNATAALSRTSDAAVGTLTLSTVFLINSQSMEWITDSQTDFITTPMVRPVGQDARTGEILWMGALGINNRRKNAVLMGISQSITS